MKTIKELLKDNSRFIDSQKSKQWQIRKQIWDDLGMPDREYFITSSQNQSLNPDNPSIAGRTQTNFLVAPLKIKGSLTLPMTNTFNYTYTASFPNNPATYQLFFIDFAYFMQSGAAGESVYILIGDPTGNIDMAIPNTSYYNTDKKIALRLFNSGSLMKVDLFYNNSLKGTKTYPDNSNGFTGMQVFVFCNGSGYLQVKFDDVVINVEGTLTTYIVGLAVLRSSAGIANSVTPVVTGFYNFPNTQPGPPNDLPLSSSSPAQLPLDTWYFYHSYRMDININIKVGFFVPLLGYAYGLLRKNILGPPNRSSALLEPNSFFINGINGEYYRNGVNLGSYVAAAGHLSTVSIKLKTLNRFQIQLYIDHSTTSFLTFTADYEDYMFTLYSDVVSSVSAYGFYLRNFAPLSSFAYYTTPNIITAGNVPTSDTHLGASNWVTRNHAPSFAMFDTFGFSLDFTQFTGDDRFVCAIFRTADIVVPLGSVSTGVSDYSYFQTNSILWFKNTPTSNVYSYNTLWGTLSGFTSTIGQKLFFRHSSGDKGFFLGNGNWVVSVPGLTTGTQISIVFAYKDGPTTWNRY